MQPEKIRKKLQNPVKPEKPGKIRKNLEKSWKSGEIQEIRMLWENLEKLV